MARISWVAPTTADADSRAVAAGLFPELTPELGYEYEPLVVGEQQYKGYYDDVGVNVLWSVWHGIEDQVRVSYRREDPMSSLAPYRAVNHALAHRVAEICDEQASVLCQDYQLMLTPSAVRVQRPDLRIVHFTHTPFPTPRSLLALPPAMARSLVGGMLGADLLGFQRLRWAERFLTCCERLGAQVDREQGWVGHNGRRTWVRCYPTPMDVPALVARSGTDGVREWALRHRGDRAGRLVVRVDRLDPAKNAVRGFQAFGRLLDEQPQLAGELHFVACLVPSRERLPDYHHYAGKTWATVDAINARHPGSITVHYGDNHERALGALCAYDVLLVNPVADGLNAVALEGPVINGRDGAVVLSTEAGSVDVLSAGAVPLAQPRSVAATTEALRVALRLDTGERRGRAHAMREAVCALRPVDWFEHQLSDVDAIGSGGAPCCPL